MPSHYLTHATLVTPEAVLKDSSLLIEDGRIIAIDSALNRSVPEVDLGGAYLLPGLIDIHADAIEKEIEPRPQAIFPLEFALRNMDWKNLHAGITTVYHSLSFAGSELGVRNPRLAAEIIDTIHAMHDALAVRTRVHARYEITDCDSAGLLQELIDRRQVHLLSLMDHTPGQGQYQTEESYRNYLMRVYRKSEADAVALIEAKKANRERVDETLKALCNHASEHLVPMASHDDDSLEKINAMQALGVGISEFPQSLEVARAAREQGLFTCLGAPNALRGQSQSSALSAREAIGAGAADCLCSDYVPSAILAALFRIHEEMSIPLAEVIALGSSKPAQALGLEDLGSISVGKQADLIAVKKEQAFPCVKAVWISGQQRLSSH